MVFQFYLKSQKMTKKFTKRWNNQLHKRVLFLFKQKRQLACLHLKNYSITLFRQYWYFNHRKPFEWVICIISKEFKGRMQNSIICNIKTTFKYMAGNWYVSYLFRNRDVPKIVIVILCMSKNLIGIYECYYM